MPSRAVARRSPVRAGARQSMEVGVVEPSRVTRRRPASYADVLAAPEHMVAEILDGELVLSPRPAPPHANASSQLRGSLHGFHGDDREGGGGEGPGGWVILFEPELHLGPEGRQVVVPDLAGWRRERLPELPEEPFFTVAPDWVCEILSPSRAADDRIRKPRIYAAAGVAHLWLVDPLERSLEVWRLDRTAAGPAWLVVAGHEGDEEARIEPFEALPLKLGRLWR